MVLVILARSADAEAGVRHALTAYFVLAILAGFGLQHLVLWRRRILSVGALAVAAVACLPALRVERPWEYHNIMAGGTAEAYRYFRNEGIDLGQRDKEIADYCRRKLEPVGEVPYVIYEIPKSDLGYRHLKVKSLKDPEESDLPPTTISGTLVVLSTATSPAIWSDNKALREERPADRFGNILVFRGTYYLPNARADALFNQARRLLEEPKPDLARIERILREGLALRPNDFSGWMMVGNVHLLRGAREQAVAAYQKARDVTPPSPVRHLFEDQIRLVLNQPLRPVSPMRDPGIE